MLHQLYNIFIKNLMRDRATRSYTSSETCLEGFFVLFRRTGGSDLLAPCVDDEFDDLVFRFLDSPSNGGEATGLLEGADLDGALRAAFPFRREVGSSSLFADEADEDEEDSESSSFSD
jgi:hypothetical protein